MLRQGSLRSVLLGGALVSLGVLLFYSSTRYWNVPIDYETPPAWWPVSDQSRTPTIHVQLQTKPFERERRQNDRVPWSRSSLLSSSKQTVSVHPREAVLPPHAPDAANMLFAFTTTAQRATDLHGLWQHYLRHGSPCIVLLPPDEADKQEELQRTLAEQCTVRVSKIERYEDRVGSIVVEAQEAAKGLRDIQWLIVGDDDTYWLDFRVLRRMLSTYSDATGQPNGDHFIGGLTEAVAQWGAFGRQAYGGAGIVLSMQLVEKMTDRFDDCLKAVAGVWTGGDGVLTYCAALIKKEDHHAVLQEEPGMHQMDVPGDGTGFFQSGLPFVTWHHYIDGWTDFFPKGCGLPETMHGDREAIAIMTESVNLLGGDNLFSRFIFDDGKTLLTLGYTVSVFDKPLLPEDLRKMEYTWSYDGYNMTFPQRDNVREGDGKKTYYLEQTDPQRLVQEFRTCAGERLSIRYEWL